MKIQTVAAGLGLLLGTCCLAAPVPKGQPKEQAILEGHQYGVVALAFGQDGAFLASAGESDGIVRLWDIAGGKCAAVLKGHTTSPGSPVPVVHLVAVAFNSDGKTLATGGLDQAIKLWDTTSGNCIATLRGSDIPRQIAFTSDGKTLASAGCDLWVWDLKTRKSRTLCRGSLLWPALAFDANGKMLVASAVQGQAPRWLPSVFILDTDTGKPTFKQEARDRGGFTRLAFSPDGKRLATGGDDCAVQLWEVATGKNIATFDAIPGRIMCLSFSPNGKILACGFKYMEAGNDANPRRGGVRLYDPATGKVLATLKGDPGPVAPLAFSPNGRLLATGSFDAKITLWRLPVAYEPE